MRSKTKTILAFVVDQESNAKRIDYFFKSVGLKKLNIFDCDFGGSQPVFMKKDESE